MTGAQQSTVRFGSIIAANYLPQARVLAATLRRWMPDHRLTVLVIDGLPNGSGGDEPFDVISPSDIGIEPREVHRMAAIYEVIELATAVKPWLLAHLLGSGADVAVYLDPDIYVTGTLDVLEALVPQHGIVLTPHYHSTRNGVGLPELTLLRYGVMNLGFIAVSSERRDFLAWWQERLARNCLRDEHPSIFVDQRWIDEIQSFWPAHVLRDSTWNVAYWNAEDRTFHFERGRWHVDGSRLHFFHFSGFDPSVPHELTWHAEVRANRVRFADPGLRDLASEYAEALRAEGWPTSTPYGWGRSAAGARMTPTLRRFYRLDLEARQEAGRDLPDPFYLEDNEGFEDWRRRRLPWLCTQDTLRRWARTGRHELRAVSAACGDIWTARRR